MTEPAPDRPTADPTSEGPPSLTGPLELASPLSLLMDEEQHGDGQAREVLLLSYSADLGFFETFALGLTRACGARTALISDVRMTTADPRAARSAGRSYLPGLAHCSGAFHPKLVLIAGAQRVVAAIGSGNATLAGWQANAELWTVHRGDPSGSPAILGELSSWLRTLPETVRLSRGSGRACADAADQIDELIGKAPTTDPQVRLVSNLTTPIINDLPDGPVDELAVFAPFHDSGALALRALVRRLEPRHITLAYQPKLTVLDQPAVAQLAAELTASGTLVRVLADPEQRYRHGKLVEWTVAGRRWALTGSPNLSSPALLETVASGGNCELGVICSVPETLLPAGVEEPATAMRPAPAGSRSHHGSGPVLLGATRSGPDALHIQLGRKLQGTEGQVFISPASAPPESWDWLAAVPTGATDLEVFIALPASSRVRVSQIGPDGQLRHSNIVCVLDEVRARAEHANPFATPQPRTQPVDLFTDAVLARRFVDEMVAFTSRNPPAPAAAAHSSAIRDDVSSSATAGKSWQTYLDECVGRMGQPLLNFALGLLLPVGAGPADTAHDADSGSRPDVRVSVVDWLEDAGDDREAGLSSDTAEEAASSRIDPGPAWVVLDLARESEQIRRAYQRYAARLAEAGERRGAKVVDLLSITRMILIIAAGGAWPDQDPERWRLLARSLRALAKVDLQQAEGAVASLTALVLSAFRSAAPRGSHGDVELLFEDVTRTVSHLLPAVQRELVAGYAQWLEPAFGLAVDVDVVLDRAAAIVQDDPIDDALWLLQDRGRDVHRHGEHLLHVTGRFPNGALMVALTAVGAAERSRRVGAWAGQAGQAWALCVWEPPNLYVVVPSKPRYRWRHYRFPGLSGPATAAAQGELPVHFLVPHGPQNQPFADAEAALDRLSLEGPEPPGSC